MEFVNKSREDAVKLTRREQMCMTFLMNAASALAEAKDDMKDRLGMIDGGQDMMDTLVDGSMKLLTEVRMTIPEHQRTHLANTARDYEMRLVPKFTPSKTNVIVQKEEFRKLVDAAQRRCLECADTYEEAEKGCDLFRLLTTILPLDDYSVLKPWDRCPYDQAEWGN